MKEAAEVFKFAGVSLGGGKTDKTAVALVDYFPKQKRLFLRSLLTNITSSDTKSSDLQLNEILSGTKFKFVAFDVPLQMPLCTVCDPKCPGIEGCKRPHVKWMWEHYKKRHKTKRPNKLFTPYTERCAEMYISSELEESFFPGMRSVRTRRRLRHAGDSSPRG